MKTSDKNNQQDKPATNPHARADQSKDMHSVKGDGTSVQNKDRNLAEGGNNMPYKKK